MQRLKIMGLCIGGIIMSIVFSLPAQAYSLCDQKIFDHVDIPGLDSQIKKYEAIPESKGDQSFDDFIFILNFLSQIRTEMNNANHQKNIDASYGAQSYQDLMFFLKSETFDVYSRGQYATQWSASECFLKRSAQLDGAVMSIYRHFPYSSGAYDATYLDQFKIEMEVAVCLVEAYKENPHFRLHSSPECSIESEGALFTQVVQAWDTLRSLFSSNLYEDSFELHDFSIDEMKKNAKYLATSALQKSTIIQFTNIDNYSAFESFLFDVGLQNKKKSPAHLPITQTNIQPISFGNTLTEETSHRLIAEKIQQEKQNVKNIYYAYKKYILLHQNPLQRKIIRDTQFTKDHIGITAEYLSDVAQSLQKINNKTNTRVP